MKIAIDFNGALKDIKKFIIDNNLDKNVINNNGNTLEEIFGCDKQEEIEFWKENIFRYLTLYPIRSDALNIINSLKGNKNNNINILVSNNMFKSNSTKKLYDYILKETLKANGIKYDEVTYYNDEADILTHKFDVIIGGNLYTTENENNTKFINFYSESKENCFKVNNWIEVSSYLSIFEKYRKTATGKASIDKPWLKFYRPEIVKQELPKMTMYDYLYECNKDNLNDIAINYYGRNITYGNLFDEICKTEKSLLELGIKEGDIVSVASPFLPEIVYLIYALNKIGAVVNMVDPRVPAEKFKSYINDCNSNYLFVIDKCYPKIEKIKDTTNLKKTIFISPSESLPLGLKYVSKVKDKLTNEKIYYNNNYISWSNFIKNGIDSTKISNYQYKINNPAIIVYTSGTSGEPKGAISSNEAFNSMAKFQTDSIINTKRGDKFLLIMPPFIAYGLSIGLHNQLCAGQTLLMIPTFNIDNSKAMLGKLVKKYRPETIMGVPTFMVDLIEHPKMQNLNCKFLKNVIVGGDSMVPSAEERVNNFLAARYSEAVIRKGWGLTEVNSCFTYTRDSKSNAIGSVGIPLYGNNIKIVKPLDEDATEIDIDSLEELNYNEVGEIFITSPTAIIDYLNNSEESKKVFFTSKSNGEKWIRTKDLGYINEDGLTFINGRMKRIIIRPDGHNVSPFAIENLINSHKKVEICAVVPSPSLEYDHGSMPVAYVQLKKEYEGQEKEVEKELKELISLNLPPRDIANEYKFIDEIPYTNIGKVDYKNLENRETEKKLLLKKNI